MPCALSGPAFPAQFAKVMTETEPEVFTWPARVYWEDTDAGGVVYHAGYLRFMERARTEWLRALGVEQGDLRTHTALAMVVRDMQIDFLAPARLDDALTVSVHPVRVRAASLVFEQAIWRADDTRNALVQARVRVACIDADKMRPAPIPPDLLQRIPP